MRLCICLAVIPILLLGDGILGQNLPTVFEYYTDGGIKNGLQAPKGGFKLNGKDIIIQSGAIHYFRVHPKLWRDRLQKLRASGLIAVETYVPWNLHEPEEGVYDFGKGGRDFSEFLDIRTFIQIAQEEDLLVLLRPGPFICAEWEMGGLPSWLLNIPDIKIRTSNNQYFDRVSAYFNQLLPLVQDLQFTKNGSIIAIQLENEYANVGYPEGPDQTYLKNLKTLMDNNGIVELLYTSDNSPVELSSIPEALRTINFQSNVEGNLNRLLELQPDKPPMVMEFWTGWFDHWMNPVERLGFTPQGYRTNLETIMKFPASFNLYMFHGGTSFGFLNGANSDNGVIFDVTSYDYYAPLSESGDYTEKYNITEDLVATYQTVKLNKPPRPAAAKKIAYPALKIQDYLTLSDILDASGSALNLPDLTNMESLDINNGNGQSFGYILYRKTNLKADAKSTLKITGRVHDIAQVFLDGKLQTKVIESSEDINGFGFWKAENAELVMADSGSTLDILVENLGRINFGPAIYSDKKGLFDGPALLNGNKIENWQAYPLEFSKKWVQGLGSKTWKPLNIENGAVAPGLYRTILTIADEPADTFLDTTGWTKGIVIVNGFNLGRFNKLGPQQALYLPAPLLVKGDNEIIIFEQFIPSTSVSFSNVPKLGG